MTDLISSTGGGAASGSTAARPRFAFIEVARVVAIFVVLVAHSIDMVVMQAGQTPLTLVLSPAVRFAVPAFLMISGLLLGIRHRDPDYRLDAGDFWRKRARTLILPFFVWNLIYMVVLVAIPGGSVFNLQTLFSLTTGYIHLYFVAVLLQCLAIYTLLAKSFGPRKLKLFVTLAALSSLAFYATSEVLLWTQGADGHSLEWSFGKLFCGWVIFFFWGVWLGYRKDSFERLSKYRFWLLLAALAALVPYWWETVQQMARLGSISRDYFLLSGLPFQFLGANAFLAFFCGLEPRIPGSRLGARLASWGPLMFGVYLAHYAVLLYLAQIWQIVVPASPALVEIAALAVVTFAITMAFVWVCNTRYLWPVNAALFGGRGRKPVT